MLFIAPPSLSEDCTTVGYVIPPPKHNKHRMYNYTIRATHVISTGPEQVPAAVHLERRNDLAHADLIAHVEVNGREELPRDFARRRFSRLFLVPKFW